jgi:hypothetical protein
VKSRFVVGYAGAVTPAGSGGWLPDRDSPGTDGWLCLPFFLERAEECFGRPVWRARGGGGVDDRP